MLLVESNPLSILNKMYMSLTINFKNFLIIKKKLIEETKNPHSSPFYMEFLFARERGSSFFS